MTDPYQNHELRKFLDSHRVVSGKGNEASMTGMGTHKGSWYVSDAEYPKFLDLMYTYLFEDEFRPNNFVEQRKTDGIAPLLIDLDFKYSKEKNLHRTFSEKHITDFVGEIIKVIKEYFDVKDRVHLRFFVTLRPQPYIDSKTKNDNEKIKDGIHIVCPDFSIGKEHYAFIRGKLLESKAFEQCFAETYYTNKPENVFDECMGNKQGWFFYGESKLDIPPYLLYRVFKYNPKTGKVTQDATEYTPRQLLEMLSIRYSLNKPLSVLDEHKDTVEKAVLKAKNPVVLVPAPTVGEVIGILPMLVDSFNKYVTTEDDITLARRFTLECLSVERADGFDSWMRVGWCLRNIDPSLEMFDIWMKFSEKSSSYASNNVEHLKHEWLKGIMRRVNGSMEIRMGSLKMWARADNPVKYAEIMDGDIISFITKAGITFKGGTHYHVAQMIQRLFPDIYKCAVDSKSTDWYTFKNHIWSSMPSGLLIKSRITDEIADKVDIARKSLRAPDEKDPDYEGKYKNYTENMTKLLKLQENLYNANFKDSVLKEATQIFYDEEFTKQINQNPYKIGCANGILNLKEPIFDEEGKKVIRYKPTLHPGVAEDYVSLCVGQKGSLGPINYVPYDPSDPIYVEIMDFFTKLFPPEDLRDYVLTLMAGCLEGANKEQCFYLMTGSGGNGKSKLVELMCSVMGQYSGSLSTTALTRKRPDSGAANPDIICVKGCRFIETKEPDEGEPLNSARMKQFSGEDLVEARALFKDQESFKITGKIFMSCNRMPPVHSMDGGTWRRIRVIPFDSRFVDPNEFPVDEANHVYARDDMMEEKLLSWRVPFFSLLVHLYETRYVVGRIKVPEVVMQACENYKGNFDSFGKFHKSRVRKVPGWEEPPQFNDIWRAYRTWTADENPTGKKLSQNELRIRLNEIYQVPADGKTYKHIRLFFSEEEVEEFDKEVAGEAV